MAELEVEIEARCDFGPLGSHAGNLGFEDDGGEVVRRVARLSAGRGRRVGMLGRVRGGFGSLRLSLVGRVVRRSKDDGQTVSTGDPERGSRITGRLREEGDPASPPSAAAAHSGVAKTH